jgi:hypothetical protein
MMHDTMSGWERLEHVIEQHRHRAEKRRPQRGGNQDFDSNIIASAPDFSWPLQP